MREFDSSPSAAFFFFFLLFGSRAFSSSSTNFQRARSPGRTRSPRQRGRKKEPTQKMVADGLTSVTPDGDILRVREVWADNLDEEMALIRGIVERHPFVAMDTEFPGVVARPVGNFRNSGEYHYQTLR